LKCYDKAIVLNPNHDWVHHNRGVVLEEKGRDDEALKAYERALAINPDLGEAYNNLANLLRKRNQLDRAIELLRKAVSLEASASSQESKSKYRGRMRDATPFFNLGTALQAKKSWKESVQALREADRRLPNNAAILAELGASLFGAGNFDEA